MVRRVGGILKNAHEFKIITNFAVHFNTKMVLKLGLFTASAQHLIGCNKLPVNKSKLFTLNQMVKNIIILRKLKIPPEHRDNSRMTYVHIFP